MTTFEPLQHQKTPSAAFIQIREAILTGALPPGTQLREAHIATEMKISRSPVREALSRLEEEGLVEKVAFRGAFVASVSPVTVAEIAQIRVLVEPYVVNLALAGLSASDWKILEGLVAKLDRATDQNNKAAQIETHLAFHRFFYERCGNAQLLALWMSWESKLKLFLILDHEAFADIHGVAAVHTELCEIFRSGDRDRILSAVAHHIHDAPGTEVSDGHAVSSPDV
ncbi:GntR family transcriptional regulator [Mycobacterium sp. 155]|uniref:GntR family transcriptional regulator n=1 Tax=Mycobacterium sp. 155 TaxID=1157943 RepID=UPI00035D4CBD|nr:GntR family transcriptional regulator [Mycobacterium sp. 155]